LSLKFSQITDRQQARWSSGYGEFNRVLGGGVVPGSLVLIGGDPGIGKSTLLLQVANRLSEERRILYVSGEESGQQVKLRASRLGVGENFDSELSESEQTDSIEDSELPPATDPKLYVLAETDLEEILKELELIVSKRFFYRR
jgi:DNA repair protein RadA/Sms